jgi:CTP:molybdopterin cytidylyltransferase MocA
MYESAMIGLSFIMEKCARTFFCPIDIPLFTADTVRKLMKSDASVVKPVCGGKEGHPILIDTRLIPALSGSEPAREAAEPDEPERNGARSEEGGLKVALAKFENVTVRIEVNDDGILYDADTPEDMRKLIDML